MKKSNICFFIILIFAGFVFWKGWTSLRVKPDSFGVVFTKTNGVLDKPIIPGEFSWNWQFLLPTNAKLELFAIEPVSIQQKSTGQLPSGELYTKSLNSNYSFDYQINYDISITLSTEAVVELIKLNQVTNNDDLKKYLEAAAKTIAQYTTDLILKRIQENPCFRPESLRTEDILRSIQSYKEFPLVEVFSISISDVKLPDWDSYNKLKNIFLYEAELNSNSTIDNKNSNSNVQKEGI